MSGTTANRQDKEICRFISRRKKNKNKGQVVRKAKQLPEQFEMIDINYHS